MKMATDCLKTIVNTLIDHCGLADAPVNILIGRKLYDVVDFYFDEDIYEYVMVLEGGYDFISAYKEDKE